VRIKARTRRGEMNNLVKKSTILQTRERVLGENAHLNLQDPGRCFDLDFPKSAGCRER